MRGVSSAENTGRPWEESCRVAVQNCNAPLFPSRHHQRRDQRRRATFESHPPPGTRSVADNNPDHAKDPFPEQRPPGDRKLITTEWLFPALIGIPGYQILLSSSPTRRPCTQAVIPRLATFDGLPHGSDDPPPPPEPVPRIRPHSGHNVALSRVCGAGTAPPSITGHSTHTHHSVTRAGGGACNAYFLFLPSTFRGTAGIMHDAWGLLTGHPDAVNLGGVILFRCRQFELVINGSQVTGHQMIIHI